MHNAPSPWGQSRIERARLRFATGRHTGEFRVGRHQIRNLFGFQGLELTHERVRATDSHFGQRLRVAVVSHGFLPLRGGAETHHALGAARLSQDAEVRVITASACLGQEYADRWTNHRQEVSILGTVLRVDYLPSMMVLNEKMISPLALAACLIRSRPDVIWTNHPSASSLTAGVLAKLLSKRWVVSYHAELELDSWVRRVFMAIEFRLLKRADSIEVSTPLLKKRLEERGIAPAAIHVVPPYTWPAHLGTVRRESRPGAALAPGPDHPYLFVGGLDRYHAYKHPEDLIQAVSVAKRSGVTIFATIVGGGERKASLIELCEKLGIKDQVRFVGQLSAEELGSAYDSAWALVLPSRGSSEGFGLVILEAVSHGCPFVATDCVPGAARFTLHGCGFQYDSTDLDELARKLALLWTQPESRNLAADRCAAVDLRFENDKNLDTLAKLVTGLEGVSRDPPLSPVGNTA